MTVRFAPSPTGRFHIGNLRTAWISHRFAKELGKRWLVRFEDIDRPRVLAGAREKQIEDLRSLGLISDAIRIQSESFARHETLFQRARSEDLIYPCTCSRREVQGELERMASAPHRPELIYHGNCRTPARRPAPSGPEVGWRFKNAADALGTQDFMIGRSRIDGSGFQPAYHWACAIDDFDSRSDLLVRASDLQDVVPFQKQIWEWVTRTEGNALPYPAVFHTALIKTNEGGRLEKRTRGVTLAELNASGIESDALLKIFESSFPAQEIQNYAPGRIWGEKPSVLTLAALGIPVTFPRN